MDINAEISDMRLALASLEAKAKAQETKLTPVSFKSKGELAKALVAGRTFETTVGATLIYKEGIGWGSPFRVMLAGLDIGAIERNWSHYDNLYATPINGEK